MDAKRVLVIGAFGWTAITIVQALWQAGHEIIAFDLPTAVCPDAIRPLLSEVIWGDVTAFEQVDRTVRTADAIIHLAVAVKKTDYDAPDIPFTVNVKGTYHVFQAARQHNVQQIILMSSAAVHLSPPTGRQLDALTDWHSSPGDDHLYDLTKRLQEVIARDFCETFGMNSVVLRAGHIVDGRSGVDPQGRPLASLQYCHGGWVCRYDLAQAYVKALTLVKPGFHAYHIIGSQAAYRNFDIERAEQELGLTFENRFEAYQ
jgi:uronate dehydrogenase